MSAPTTYDIRPAALRGSQTYTLTQEGIETKGETPWSLSFSELDKVTFVQHRLGDQLFWRLDLESADKHGRVETSFPYSGRTENEDCTAFIGLTDAFCAGLQQAQPDMQIGYGEHGKSRLVFFAIGVVSTVFGLGILIAAVLTGISGERLVGGGIAIALLVVLGVVLMRAYRPGRKPLPVDAKRLPKVLRYLAGR